MFSKEFSEEDRINLQALRNRDPDIIQILDQAQRVCMYKFLPEKREWERKDIEGTLFVYERNCQPYHGFTILSTVSRETFVQIIQCEMEFKYSNNCEAFLQYKVDHGDIYGIWFISKNDCPRVTQCLQDLTNRTKESKSNPTTDIFSLLINAQEKFQESKRKQETDEREEQLKKALGISQKLNESISTESCTLTNAIQHWTTSHQSPIPENGHVLPFQTNHFSKDTLRQILLHMLQNDEEFLNSLHRAYTQKYNNFHGIV